MYTCKPTYMLIYYFVEKLLPKFSLLLIEVWHKSTYTKWLIDKRFTRMLGKIVRLYEKIGSSKRLQLEKKNEKILCRNEGTYHSIFFHITIYMSRKFEESPRTLGSRFLNDKYLIYRIHDLSINLINYKIGMMMHRRAGMAVLHRSKYLTTKLICKKLFFRHKAQILK